MEKMRDCWRGYKSALKVAHFDGRTHNEAINRRTEHFPHMSPEIWENLVKFWESYKGKARSARGIGNRANSKLPHYVGTYSCKRGGNKLDKLQMWLKTHDPHNSKLDNASAMAKETIDTELAQFEDSK